MPFSAGTAYLTVVPSFVNIQGAFEREAKNIGKAFDNAIKDAVPDAIRKAAKEGAQAAEREGAAGGDKFGGAFAKTMQRHIDKASKAVGRFEVKPDTKGAERELAHLGARLEALGKAKINVEVDEKEALSEIGMIRAAAEDLDRDGVSIEIRSNAREVASEMRLLLRDLQVNVDVDTGGAQVALAEVAAEIHQIGGANPHVDIDTNAGKAAAELAVVQEEVNRLDGRTIDVNTDTRSLRDLANEAGVSMSRMGILISLGASLGAIVVPAAAAAAAAVGAIGVAAGAAGLGFGALFLGLDGVFKAVNALNQAQQSTAKSGVSFKQAQDRVANALDQVRSAERNLAQTREAVARGARDAARAVISAERGVVDAEREAADAVRDLVRAQREAQQAEEDRAFALRENSLAQQQAVLDIAEAQDNLNKILANPRATDAERKQAQITFEQRKLQLEELGATGVRTQQDQERAAKEGADNVIAAQDRVRKTTQAVADSQERLALAIEAQTQGQVDGARQMVAAQEGVARSNRALAQAYDKTGIAGGAAVDNVRKAMDALSPAGQRFALFIFGLKPAFDRLKASAEGGLLPGLEKAIRNLLPLMPSLEKVIGSVAGAIGDTFVMWSDALHDPVFVKFFSYLGSVAGPVLQGMAQFTLNVTKGILGVINGLSGFNAPIGNGLLKWSEGFAHWAETLDKNEGWKKFLDYVKRVGPKVVDLLAGVWDFTKKIVIAAAPIGEKLVDALSSMFDWLNTLDPETLSIIVAGLAGIAAALVVVAGVTSLLATGIAGGIVILIGVVAVALVLLYQKVKPFRAFVDATIKAIATAAVWLWTNVLKPTFEALVRGVQFVIGIWQDLYDTIFVHAFAAIKAIFLAWWETVKTVFEQFSGVFSVFKALFLVGFGLFQIAVKIAAAVFSWFWDHVLKPIFSLIGVAFEVFKVVFQVAFGLFQIGVKIIAGIFRWLYDKAFKPTWDLIKPIFQWLADVITKFVVPPFKKGLENLGKAWDVLVDLAKFPIKFIINTVLNDGLLAGYNKVAKFFKVKPDDVHIDLPKGFARGGAVRGPGTATSDSIWARLSDDEHVWTAREVRAAGGHRSVEALRQAALDGAVPGFARGGGVGDGIGSWLAGLKKKATDAYTSVKDFFSDPMGALRKLGDRLFNLIPYKDSQAVQTILGMPKRGLDLLVDKVKNLFGSVGKPTGVVPGGLGYQRMEQILRGAFPNVSIFSDYRPGAITSTGNRSYHAVGRAVDMTPSEPIFNWIASHFPDSRELIFSPMGGRQIHDGTPYLYGEPTRSEHFDHVHWAYDQGGMLPPGLTMAYNGTGRPEPVLTAQQWDHIGALTAGGGPGGNSYSFNFRDTTLTPGKLRAIQDRESLINRDSRAR